MYGDSDPQRTPRVIQTAPFTITSALVEGEMIRGNVELPSVLPLVRELKRSVI